MVLTSISILPRGLGLLSFDLLLNLGLLVDVVEVVHNDRDRKRDAEHSADCTNLFAIFTFFSFHLALLFNPLLMLLKVVREGVRNVFHSVSLTECWGGMDHGIDDGNKPFDQAD